MYRVWHKDHTLYDFFKYKLYKPIRNWLCHYGYGYHLCEDELIERQRKFIMSLKK